MNIERNMETNNNVPPSKPEFNIESSTEHRRNVREGLTARVITKLEELQAYSQGTVPESENVPANHSSRVEAGEVFRRITEAKKDKPELSLFELIENVIEEKTPTGTVVEFKGSFLGKTLFEARDLILAEASDQKLWSELRDKEESIQHDSTESGMMAKLDDLVERAETYGTEVTMIGKTDPKEEEVPYYDFKGVNKRHAQVVKWTTELGFLRAKLEMDGRIPEDNSEYKRLKDQIDLYKWGTQPTAIFDKTARIVRAEREEKIREERRRQDEASRANYEKRRLKLEYGSAEPMLDWVINRTAVSPEVFAQQRQQWFVDLGISPDPRTGEPKLDMREARKLKGVVEGLLAMNYIAYVKETTGSNTTKSWHEISGIRIERDALVTMREEMPGFSEAMAMLVDALFEVKDGDGNVRDHFVLKKGAYKEYLEDDKKFKQLRDSIAAKIQIYLQDNPEASMKWAKAFGLVEQNASQLDQVMFNKLAASAVAAADNYFFATGAYDSADESRPESAEVPDLDASSVTSDSIRADMQIYPKLRAKIMKGHTWGGPGGEWLRQRYENATVQLRASERKVQAELDQAYRDKKPNKGKIERLKRKLDLYKDAKVRYIDRELSGYMPKRMFFDMSHHVQVDDKGKRGLDQYILEGVANSQEVTLSNGQKIRKFRDGDVDFGKIISGDELWGGYGVTRAAALAIVEHIKGGDPKYKLSPDALMTNWLKLQKDPTLEKELNNPRFIQMAVGFAISPEGFKEGTDEIVLKIDQRSDYQTVVNEGLDRFIRLFEEYKGPDPFNLRKNLLRSYHTSDYNNILNIIGDMFMSYSFLQFLSDRYQIEKQIKKRKKQLQEQILEDRENFEAWRRLTNRSGSSSSATVSV